MILRPMPGLLLVVAMASVAASSAAAAKDRWNALHTPRFDVVSQLDEKQTRRWAGEFAQFVDALHELYDLESDRALPPLTMVLFDQSKGFAPYRPVTESGQSKKVEAMFGRQAHWSVIGMTGRRGAATTRRVIQHEAVHWFFSANSVQPPLWFGEGFAEVFSTFEIKDGQGRWGQAIPEHVEYLRQVGLLPLESFFGVSQDEALHGNKRFYPQAWAFVHFGLFGDRGVRQASLSKFLELLQTEPRETAFRQAFGQTYAEVDVALKRYLQTGKYAMATVDLPDTSADFAFAPATTLQVETALGRLALAGGNTALTERHANTLIASAPDRAEGYELLAVVSASMGNQPAQQQALAAALALGSRDPQLHLLDATYRMQQHYQEDTWPDQALAPHQARTITDGVARALALHPRNPEAFELLVMALMNVSELTPQDERLLALGQRLLPRSGLMLLPRAAAANRRGDLTTARTLLREAKSEERELPARFRLALGPLGDRWVADWFSARGNDVETLADLDAFEAILDHELAAADQSPLLRKALLDLSNGARTYRLHLEGVAAFEDDDPVVARQRWQAIIDDPNASPTARADARRALRSLE